ncbi:copper resistance CopC family protein [Galactobacter valiniphilus]|uniref:copper resistance CopC family protein n=1 Tax=Galactobacter valiniphilus TaxID=2676122 RepID=UPI001313DFA6|nr:copper resistance CopC family protein [Galactobacter valiniphilus]
MSTTAPRPLRSRLALALAGALALLAAPFIAAAPAQAHDQFLGGTPKAGSAIEVAPDTITLTFSAEIKQIAGTSNAISVTDRDGKEYATGDVKIDGAKLSRALTALPAGTYDVSWSALSSDGHRIHSNDDYAFTVTKGEKAKPAASSGAASSAKATAAPAKSPAASASAQASGGADVVAETAPTVMIMWIVAGFLVLAIVLGIILQLTRKKPGSDEF